MPKIFEYFGFVFFFYSNEHEPIHVHVIRGQRQSIFELILEDGVVVSLFIQKWVDYFIMKKKIDCTEIKIRL
jgi:hypothetical protein